MIDTLGFSRIFQWRKDEFLIALATAVVVCAVGVEQGIILAVIASLVGLIRRQYRPSDFVIARDSSDTPVFLPATAGTQSAPGLIVYRYDASLFYANANRFVDEIETLIETAPDPVRWIIADASSMTDMDYSAGLSVRGLLYFLKDRNITFALAFADPSLRHTLDTYGLLDKIGEANIYPDLRTAAAAFAKSTTAPTES